ncbi:MAG TPA: GAF domain-containing protein [Pyrinomonadaceae bacterium]|nr:GAF domain-containing protein [Pyrinomonadaceae bacterium]
MDERLYSKRLAEFARALCSAQDYRSLLDAVVKETCRNLDAENLLLWVRDDQGRVLRCEAVRLTTLKRGSVREVCPADQGILGEALRAEAPGQAEGFRLTDHLSVAEGAVPSSALFAPLREDSQGFGILEAINKRDGRFTEDDAALLDEFSRLAAPAIAARRAQEAMGEGMLRALTRLTLLYDVSQSFNSTIDLQELAPIICNRTANVMEVESCSLWLVEKTEMVCRAFYGRYRRELVGYVETDAGTVVGEMLRDNAPLLINDPGDPRLAGRFAHLENGSITALICAPVKYEGTWLGGLEIINKRDGGKFTESDADLLTEIAAQAANSIRNAERHQAERKVKELQALLRTSREITSSLDLDRMLTVVVNQVATIIPFDRCAIALQTKGRYEIDAIAGEAEVNSKDPRVKAWNEIINWAGQMGAELYISEQDGEIDSNRIETREKFRAHFNASGMRSFYALPLTDEEGQLGVLALESQTPRFLNASHLELLKIFAGQATVAIRNAQLYRQVPLIGALEPLAAKKRAFLSMPKAKRTATMAIAAAVLLLLIFFPWNLKVGGNAYVLPTRTVTVNAEVDGIIDQVNYREGDLVPAGAVVATLRSDEYLFNLNDAKARYDILARELTRLQAASGAAAAQIERVKLEQTQREIALNQAKLEQTQIRSHINGVIITPRIEEMRGRYIRRGEVFCETADLNPIIIEAAIPEDDIGLVTPGQEVWLKANAFPSRKFTGRVAHISPQATIEQGARVFIVRAEVENADQSLRTGMLGRVKILTGLHSIGYVLLRDPARWLQKKVWSWMP